MFLARSNSPYASAVETKLYLGFFPTSVLHVVSNARLLILDGTLKSSTLQKPPLGQFLQEWAKPPIHLPPSFEFSGQSFSPLHSVAPLPLGVIAQPWAEWELDRGFAPINQLYTVGRLTVLLLLDDMLFSEEDECFHLSVEINLLFPPKSIQISPSQANSVSLFNSNLVKQTASQLLPYYSQILYHPNDNTAIRREVPPHLL